MFSPPSRLSRSAYRLDGDGHVAIDVERDFHPIAHTVPSFLSPVDAGDGIKVATKSKRQYIAIHQIAPPL